MANWKKFQKFKIKILSQFYIQIKPGRVCYFVSKRQTCNNRNLLEPLLLFTIHRSHGMSLT
jgi:hypothetical protein